MYTCILADPPWAYNDKLQMEDVRRSAEDQYAVMPTSDICGMGVTQDGWQVIRLMGQDYTVADTALLWLWVTNSFLVNGHGPRVCRAWGFVPKQVITWVKGTKVGSTLELAFGMGRYTRGCTEHLLLATRGRATSLVTNHSVRNIIVAPARQHSQKPDAAYELIERMQGSGPRLELFARHCRPGWLAVGDELIREDIQQEASS